MAALNHPGLELFQYRERYVEGCNLSPQGFTVTEVDGFQYRERYVEGCNQKRLPDIREAILEFQYRERYVEGCNAVLYHTSEARSRVSIPRTVCGGLQ